MTDLQWSQLQTAVIILGVAGLVMLEVVRTIKGAREYTRHTYTLWFGPLRRYLSERATQQQEQPERD